MNRLESNVYTIIITSQFRSMTEIRKITFSFLSVTCRNIHTYTPIYIYIYNSFDHIDIKIRN